MVSDRQLNSGVKRDMMKKRINFVLSLIVSMLFTVSVNADSQFLKSSTLYYAVATDSLPFHYTTRHISRLDSAIIFKENVLREHVQHDHTLYKKIELLRKKLQKEQSSYGDLKANPAAFENYKATQRAYRELSRDRRKNAKKIHKLKRSLKELINQKDRFVSKQFSQHTAFRSDINALSVLEGRLISTEKKSDVGERAVDMQSKKVKIAWTQLQELELRVSKNQEQALSLDSELSVLNKELTRVKLNLQSLQVQVSEQKEAIHFMTQNHEQGSRAADFSISWSQLALNQLQTDYQVLTQTRDALLSQIKRAKDKLKATKKRQRKQSQLIAQKKKQLQVDQEALSSLQSQFDLQQKEMRQLNYDLYVRLSQLSRSYCRDTHHSRIYLERFDSRFQAMTALSQRLLNQQKRWKHATLSLPVARNYYVSPYIGFKLFNDSLRYSGAKEAGVRLGYYLAEEGSLFVGFGYASYMENQLLKSRNIQEMTYQVGLSQNLNPLERAQFFFQTGLAGDFNSSDPRLFIGSGFNYFKNDATALRFDMRYDQDVFFSLGVQSHILVREQDSDSVQLDWSLPRHRKLTVFPETAYPDLVGNWIQPDVQLVTRYQLLDYKVGTQNSEFFPQKVMTVKEAATALGHAFYFRETLAKNTIPISFNLNASAQSDYVISIVVKNKAGEIVRVLASNRPVNLDQNVYHWDGKDVSQAWVPKGHYSICLTLMSRDKDQRLGIVLEDVKRVKLSYAKHPVLDLYKKGSVAIKPGRNTANYLLRESLFLTLFDPLAVSILEKTPSEKEHLLNQGIRRDHFMAAVGKLLVLNGAERQLQSDIERKFSDWNRVEPLLREDVLVFCEALQIKEGSLNPIGVMTREEGAIILAQLMKYLSR